MLLSVIFIFVDLVLLPLNKKAESLVSQKIQH